MIKGDYSFIFDCGRGYTKHFEHISGLLAISFFFFPQLLFIKCPLGTESTRERCPPVLIGVRKFRKTNSKCQVREMCYSEKS